MLNVNPIFLAETWESFAEVDKSKSHQVSKFSFFFGFNFSGKRDKNLFAFWNVASSKLFGPRLNVILRRELQFVDNFHGMTRSVTLPGSPKHFCLAALTNPFRVFKTRLQLMEFCWPLDYVAVYSGHNNQLAQRTVICHNRPLIQFLTPTSKHFATHVIRIYTSG